MNKETKDQIAREAESLYPDIGEDGVNEYMFSKDEIKDIQRLSYIAGAETWAERGEVLKAALELIVSDATGALRDTDSIKAHQRILNRATEALSNYNNPVK